MDEIDRMQARINAKLGTVASTGPSARSKLRGRYASPADAAADASCREMVLINETVLIVPRIGVGPMSKYTTSVIMSAAVSVATLATAHAQQNVLAIPDASISTQNCFKSFREREKATPHLKSE